MSSASRGLAPREGLESLLVKTGHTGPLAEPRRGPQAGKSGDPHSQNADSYFHEVCNLLSFALFPCLFEPVVVRSSRSSVFIFCQASPVDYCHMLCCYVGVL